MKTRILKQFFDNGCLQNAFWVNEEGVCFRIESFEETGKRYRGVDDDDKTDVALFDDGVEEEFPYSHIEEGLFVVSLANGDYEKWKITRNNILGELVEYKMGIEVKKKGDK